MKVIMAERSDIYRDARVQKEATSLANNNYKVEVWGFRSTWKKEPVDYKFSLFTFPVISRKFRVLRNVNMALNIFIISLAILWKKADCYHAHNTMFLLAMYLSSRFHKGKFIYDSHEVQWERSGFEAFLEKVFINKVDKVINVSEGRAKIQRKRYNVPEDKIMVIANYPVVSDNGIEIKPNSSDRLNCIFSGGFDLGSNRLDKFVLAIKETPNVTFSLLSFGYGRSKHELLQLIKTLNLEDRVCFLPLVTSDKVIATISSYDFAVNLMTNKNNLVALQFPAINKMYEYLAAGLPILTSDLPSFIDEFQNEGVGVVVNPQEVASIKEGLEYFLVNKDRIIAMKMKALELSKSKYNWSTQEKKLIRLYRTLTHAV